MARKNPSQRKRRKAFAAEYLERTGKRLTKRTPGYLHLGGSA